MLNNLLPHLVALYRTLCASTVVLFLVTGYALALLFPPFQIPDEDLHWQTANGWAENWLAPVTGRTPEPCSVSAVLPFYFHINVTKGNVTAKAPQNELGNLERVQRGCHSRPTINSGSILSYPGVLLSRLIVNNENNDPQKSLTAFYLARILHGTLLALLMFRMVFLLYARPQMMIAGPLSVLVFCLSPIFLNQGFGVTYDSVTLMFALSVATLLLFRETITTLDMAIFLATGLAACSTKPVFLPMALATLGVLWLASYRYNPERKDVEMQAPSARLLDDAASKRFHAAKLLMMGIMFVFVSVYFYFRDYGGVQTHFAEHPTIDPDFNKQFLLQNPWRSLQFLWAAGSSYLHLGHMASPLGWTNVHVAPAIGARWSGVVQGAFLVDGLIALTLLATKVWGQSLKVNVVRAFHTIVASVGVAASLYAFVMLTAVALYIRWTPKGSLGVSGLQNRYFLPFFVVGYALAAYTLSGGNNHVTTSREGTFTSKAWFLHLIGATALIGLLAPFAVELCLQVAARYY